LSRRGSPVSEPVDIAALVEEIALLLARTIDRRIEVSTQIAIPKLPLMIVRNDLVEALTNLCLNARDLMPDGGSIKIRASPWRHHKSLSDRRKPHLVLRASVSKYRLPYLKISWRI